MEAKINMDNSIVFDEGTDKKIPEFIDTDSVEKTIEKKVILKELEKDIKQEVTGETKPLTVKESVPKEIPDMIFKAGAKIIGCPLFILDNDESVLMAKHFSNIVGQQSSKLYSILIIFIVVISKISGCIGAINNKVKGLTKKDDKGNQIPI